MAESKTQTRSSETERGISRRSENYPSREFSNFSPFAMMRRLSEEMDRAFGSSFGLSRNFGESGMWSPAVDVSEQDGNMDIAVELPGISKDDVKVECTEDGVVIEGEKRHSHEETKHGVYRSERSYGRFHRMIPLPQGAETDKAKAEFKDGVLHVRVPVPETKQQRRQIPIGS